MRRTTLNIASTEFEKFDTALTGQNFYHLTEEEFANMPIGESYARSFDVADNYGTVGQVLLFRHKDGYLYAKAGSPDPRCLWKKLMSNLKLDKIVLAHRPEWLNTLS